MKNLMLAAFTALSLTAGIAPMAHAFTTGFPQTTQHSGPYDNTANSEGGRFAGPPAATNSHRRDCIEAGSSRPFCCLGALAAGGVRPF